MVGLNNIKNNDYVNVVLQCIIQIPEIRDYFLRYRREDDFTEDLSTGRMLSARLAELIKKVCNP